MGRESILRMKAVGFENTKSAVADLQKEIRRIATVAMPRQDKIIEQQIRGGLDPKAAVATWNAMVVRQQQMIGSLTQLSLHENAQIARAKELLRLKTDILQRSQGLTTAGRGGTSADTIQQGAFGALTAMGSRRILRQGAGMVAQQMMNTPGIGQEVGLALGGFLYGGPVLGGIALAGSVVAAYFRDVNEGAKQAEAATKAFSDTLMNAATAAAKLAGEFSPITKIGKTAEAASDKARESIFNLSKEIRESKPEGAWAKAWHKEQQRFEMIEPTGGPGTPQEKIKRYLENTRRLEAGEPVNTIEDRMILGKEREKKYEEDVLKASTARENESRSRAADDLGLTHGLELRALDIQAQRQTPKREREELANRQAIRDAKLKQDQKEQQIQAAIGVADAQRSVDAQQKEVDVRKGNISFSDKERDAAAAVLESEKERLEVAKKRRDELSGIHKEQERQDARVAAGETGKLESDKARQKEDLQTAYDRDFKQNEIALTTRGWGQQRAATIEKYRQRAEDEKKAGIITTNLNALQEQELAKQTKDHAESIKDIQDSLTDQYLVATRQKLQVDADWAQRSRQLFHERGETAKESIEAEKVLFYQLYQGKKGTMLADLALHQQIMLGMIRGGLSPYALQAQQMREAHPDRSDAQIRGAISGQMQVDSATFVKQERMRKDPYKVYVEYNKSLLQALGNKEITKAEYDRRKMDKAQELLGRTDGQFMDAMSYVHQTQTALLADANIPKETRDGILAIMRSVAIMVRDGIPIRG